MMRLCELRKGDRFIWDAAIGKRASPVVYEVGNRRVYKTQIGVSTDIVLCAQITGAFSRGIRHVWFSAEREVVRCLDEPEF